MPKMSTFEAKTRFGELLQRVERGEEIVITRHNRPSRARRAGRGTGPRFREAVRGRATPVAAAHSRTQPRQVRALVGRGPHAVVALERKDSVTLGVHQAVATLLLSRAGSESITYLVSAEAAILYGVWTDNVTQDPSLHFVE